MELPQLTPAQISDVLYLTRYSNGCTPSRDYFRVATQGEYEMVGDAKLNAARAILLARENERMRKLVKSIFDRISFNADIEEANGNPDSFSWTYGGLRDEMRTALAQTETKGKTE